MPVIANYQVNGSFGSKIGGSNAVQFFPRPLGPSIGVAPLTPSTTDNTGSLAVPGQNALNGGLFHVQIGGSYQTPAGTVTVALVASKALPGATPSYVVLAGTGAITPTASTRTSFSFDVTLEGDSDSGVVTGSYSSYANGAPANTAGSAVGVALDNNLTGINFNTGISGSNGVPFFLAVRVTFGTPAAANAATLYQFQVVAA